MGFQHEPGRQHMMEYGNYNLLWAVIIGVLLLIILFLVYKLIQKNKDSRIEVEEGNKALNILKERYAIGELTDEEFINKKAVLDNKQD